MLEKAFYTIVASIAIGYTNGYSDSTPSGFCMTPKGSNINNTVLYAV